MDFLRIYYECLCESVSLGAPTLKWHLRYMIMVVNRTLYVLHVNLVIFSQAFLATFSFAVFKHKIGDFPTILSHDSRS
jgi:hypothetical protein